MIRIAAGVLVFLAAAPLLAADDKPKDPPTPKEQYQDLLKEHEKAMQAYFKEAQAAKTNEERRKVFEEKYPRPEKFVPKFMALAEKYPKDPAALDALIWVVTNSRGQPTKENLRAKAVNILIRDHIKSGKLGPLCQALTFSYDKLSETFLRALLEKSPHKEEQGQACLALAQYFKNRVRIAEMVKARPEMAKAIEQSLGKETYEELKHFDAKKNDEEIVRLFERAAKDYADIRLPFRGTVGEKAKSELYEIRHLGIGKPAPDIQGEDQDGRRFRLSDYKGKVVLLDFWSQY